MRLAVTDGTLSIDAVGFARLDIPAAGKTGTAEYCDEFAAAKNLCEPGNWPSHAWSLAYAPYENPEIAVIAFAYNGGEGASVAGPIVRRVLEAYFEIKSIDSALPEIFKFLNIFLGQRVLHIHVVVKAVVDDRTNGHFNIRIELFNRMP